MIQLTEKEKRYYKDNYSEVVTEGLDLFKKCSPDVLRYINGILDPMTDTDRVSGKTLLTIVAMSYAKTELVKDILDMRKESECRTQFKVKEESVKNKVDLSKI
jgi:hypothetical protein